MREGLTFKVEETNNFDILLMTESFSGADCPKNNECTLANQACIVTATGKPAENAADNVQSLTCLAKNDPEPKVIS